jgi:hypothetical protein
VVVTGEEPSLPRYRNVAPVLGLRSSKVVRPGIDGGVTWSVSVRSGSAWDISPTSFSSGYLNDSVPGSDIGEP